MHISDLARADHQFNSQRNFHALANVSTGTETLFCGRQGRTIHGYFVCPVLSLKQGGIAAV
jgi:hypothetical protein